MSRTREIEDLAEPGQPGSVVYMDHASTSPLRPEVQEVMRSCSWGNPSGLHRVAAAAREALEQARERVAGCLGARPEEIIFTSGGTEANNLALCGLGAGGEVMVSAVEHRAVLLATRAEELPVDAYGEVDLDVLEQRLVPGTRLLSLMMANNEVGTLQPVEAAARLARQRGVLCHTDAVQAAGRLPLSVGPLGVDAMSLSAHKFGGPRGIGCLYLRRGLELDSVARGGAQEGGRRAGTENVAGAVGMALALELACSTQAAEAQRLGELARRLAAGLVQEVSGLTLTGHLTRRLPGLVSCVVPGIHGESLVMGLDAEGVCASTGSACSVATGEPSHVLRAMGVKAVHSALRLSLGSTTTGADIDAARQAVGRVVARLREVACGV